MVVNESRALVIDIKLPIIGLRAITVVSYSANSSSNESYCLGGIPKMELVNDLAVLLIKLVA